MKRIGKQLRAGLAFALAGGFTLGGLMASAPSAAADQPTDLSAIEWEPRSDLFGRTFGPVRLDADRVERVHAGMDTPRLRMSDGSPIWGAPHFFLGKDPETGAYLPANILMCIDMLHVDYEVPDGSEYFDLATLVPAETAVRISRTLNAGLQLARQNGLRINLSGKLPLDFTAPKSQDYMMAAQIAAWHAFARDNATAPLPHLERSDFSVDKTVPVIGGGAVETVEDYDLSKPFAEIDELVARYGTVPAISSAPVRIDGTTTSVGDPALAGFELEIDPEASTPGFDAYVGLTTKRDGTIELRKKRSIDKPLTIGMRKKFSHGLGMDGLASGVRAANHQFKTPLSNIFTESFALRVAADDGAVLVRKSDTAGDPLDGAEFALYDSTGGTIASDSWGRPLVGVTGSQGHGRLIFSDVPTGRYLLVETRAPEGYQRDATPREITVRPNAQTAAAGGEPIVNTRLTSDLEIHKSNGVSVLQPGELTTYEIAIANRSAYAEEVDAVIEDVLPDGLRFVSADHGGSYDSETRTVSWNVGPVGGTPIVVSVTARVEDSVAPGTTIANRATVTLDGVCPGYDDLDRCTDIDSDAVPALVLMKSNGTDVVLPGETTAYELTVVNTSEVDAPDVVIVDTLPEELGFVAADSNGHYSPGDHAVTWKLGTLGAGEQRSVRVIAWVDREVGPGSAITNLASVSSAGGCWESAASADEHPLPGDTPRSVCEVEDTDRVPAVGITKDDGTTTVLPGERLDYSIVATNASAVVAPDVVVVDQLPFYTSFVESSLPLADVSTESVLHWSLGDLAPGESREIVVSVVVKEYALPGTVIANTATISAAGVCVDDAKTETDECAAVDEDLVVSPPVSGEEEGPGAPVDEEGAPEVPGHEEIPHAPADANGPASETGPAGAAPPAHRLAATGQNLPLVLKLGSLAAVLLLTAGASALAVRRRSSRARH